jgi:hypothetical protein
VASKKIPLAPFQHGEVEGTAEAEVVPTLPAVQGGDWSMVIVGGNALNLVSPGMAQAQDDILSSQKAFGIPAGRQLAYFGNAQGLKCVRSKVEDDSVFGEEALAHPEKCSKEDQKVAMDDLIAPDPPVIMNCNRMPTPPERALYDPEVVRGFKVDPKVGAAGGSKSGVVTGNSTSEDLFLKDDSGFSRLLEQVQKGEHVSIFMADHGGKRIDPKTQKPFWEFASEDFDLTTVDHGGLAIVLRRLSQRGAIVHLSVDACNSGGFNELSSRPDEKSGGGVCAISKASKNDIGVGLEEQDPDMHPLSTHFKEFGDQLRAHACMLGEQQANPGESSLDEVVENWEKEWQVSVSQSDCLPFKKSLGYLDDYAGLVLRAIKGVGNESQERRALIESYRKVFIGTLTSCGHDFPAKKLREMKKEQTCLNQIVAETTANHSGKAVDLPKELTPEKLQDVQEVLGVNKRMLLSSETIHRVEHQLNFLKNAPVEDLRAFKAQYCCLGYSFKDKKGPDVCN